MRANLMFNKKGISPLIAVVLLILVVAIGGIAIYKWYKAQSGTIAERTGGVIGEMAKGEAFLEITGLYVKPDGIYVTIRNIGTATASDIKLYVNNKLEPATFSIDAKDEVEIKLTTLNLEDINPGDVVTIKAVASNAPAQTRVFTAKSNQWSSKMKDWNYRRKIVVSGSREELTDVPIKIVLNETNFDFSKASINDIKFVDKFGTFYEYYIDEYDPNLKRAIIYVKLPKLTQTGAEFWMYYGSAKSVYSGFNSYCEFMENLEGVVFCDDFEDYETNNPEEKGEWVKVKDETGSEITIREVSDNKVLYLEENSGDNDGVVVEINKTIDPNDIVLEYKIMMKGTGSDLDYEVIVTGGPYVYIGSQPASWEEPHRIYLSGVGMLVEGTRFLSNNWETHVFIPTSGRIMSTYANETLIAQNQYTLSSAAIRFFIHNGGHPDVLIDNVLLYDSDFYWKYISANLATKIREEEARIYFE